jgi:hypothetical protein
LQLSALTRGHSTHDISQLEGCAIAVDATYYLSQLLETPPAHEPLLSALGGLTGVESHISQNLDEWAKNDIVPFFVFDGQPVTGQDDITLDRGLKANKKTDEAWNLYFLRRRCRPLVLVQVSKYQPSTGILAQLMLLQAPFAFRISTPYFNRF